MPVSGRSWHLHSSVRLLQSLESVDVIGIKHERCGGGEMACEETDNNFISDSLRHESASAQKLGGKGIKISIPLF